MIDISNKTKGRTEASSGVELHQNVGWRKTDPSSETLSILHLVWQEKVIMKGPILNKG